MARWTGNPTDKNQARLRWAFEELLRIKPRGWSVAWQGIEISIRPVDRTAGTCCVRYSAAQAFGAVFFVDESDPGTPLERFEDTEGVAKRILDWTRKVLEKAGKS